MVATKSRQEQRKVRHRRIRRDLRGTPRRPRLFVYKSNKHIYAQLIDDINGETLTGASTRSPDLTEEVEGATVEAARKVGALIAERSLDQGVEEVVFDRGGYPYHGQVKALAQRAREEGLEF